MNKSDIKIMLIILGVIEAVLAIPIIGGIIVISTSWSILPILLLAHIVLLILSNKKGIKNTGNILGIISSSLGWIPLVGWILHTVTAVLIFIDVNRNSFEDLPKTKTLSN